ncbi:glutathione peroxidase [Clostridium thermarum]|uniref:glutathione peroxidase n=1 Tax=Clostridium thermarum TaxID=1716543 RepID=UPI00111FABF6|nr:glutathione peroxidase [Clostridium thermarum]
MGIYDFTAVTLEGEEISLSKYKGKVLLIVNTASNCGFTPQYKELQELYEKLGNEKFEILGFPCNQFGNQEPGSSSDIQNFCQLNYGVDFQMFEKIDVNGENAHPLYKYLTEQKKGFLTGSIKWNFTKFLIDKEGNIIDRFAPTTSPLKIEKAIAELINK